MSSEKRIRIEYDKTKADLMIKQAMVEADVATDRIQGVNIDADQMKEKVQLLRLESHAAFMSILRGVRRTSMIIIGLAQASGAAFDMAVLAMIQASILVGEALITLAYADATVFNYIGAAAKLAVAGMLFYKARQLKSEQGAQARRTEGLIMAVSVLMY